jgi:hypothetical protein
MEIIPDDEINTRGVMPGQREVDQQFLKRP